jgi:hypothetical protein
MSDVHSGARAPDVTGTATQQARQVGDEVKTQARNVAADVRDKVTQQAHSQNDRLVDGIRRMADDLDRMSGERGDSPASTVVSRIASSGRQVADHLSERGPDGVLNDVQDFARRRPGAFLAAALATGFVVGRLGKGILNADDSTTSAGRTKPADDAFVSDVPRLAPEPVYPTGYPDSAVEPVTGSPALAPGAASSVPPAGSTEYASTGTGTPVPLSEPAPDLSAPVRGPGYPDEGRL